MMLQRTSAHVHQVLAHEEAQLREHRHVLTEVRDVLNEMVYDVETHAHECEVLQLQRELAAAQQTLRDHEVREQTLLLERQQAFELAARVEAQTQQTIARYSDHVSVVLLELAKKDVLERDLAASKQQNALTAQLSKELAHAQRDVRDLRRQHSIQHLLRSSTPRTTNKRLQLLEQQQQQSPRSTSSQSSATSSSSTSLALVSASASSQAPLTHCPDTLLMRVFAYLDANSVFAVSLTSHLLLARVHLLFGMTTMTTMTPSTATAVKRASAPSASMLALSSSSFKQQQQQMPAPRSLQAKGRSQSVVLHTGGGSSNTMSDKERAQRLKVESIVQSLKKDEIKLFHEMSTRIKTLETHLGHVQAEKEDTAARLHGAENVRDFLIDKLKEVEDALASTLVTSSQKDDQAAVDREIMGFLDAKTHELELALEQSTQANRTYRFELQQLHDEHAAKHMIVDDMVQLLSQEKQELELQLRSQRKVLVREVKGLRAQNEALVTEKEMYFAQLKQLKHALRHLDAL